MEGELLAYQQWKINMLKGPIGLLASGGFMEVLRAYMKRAQQQKMTYGLGGGFMEGDFLVKDKADAKSLFQYA